MTDTSDIDEKARERRTASSDVSDSGSRVLKSRRRVLATLALLSGGGVALSLSDSIGLLSGENGKDDESDSGDGELLMSREADIRSELHATRPSMTPSFEYDPVDKRFDDPEIPIERVTAEAAREGTGDQIAFVLSAGQAHRFGEAMIAFWTDADTARTYQTSIGDDPIEFDVYAGGEVAVGAAVREGTGASGRAELFMARGYDQATVEELLETFDTFYGQ